MQFFTNIIPVKSNIQFTIDEIYDRVLSFLIAHKFYLLKKFPAAANQSKPQMKDRYNFQSPGTQGAQW